MYGNMVITHTLYSDGGSRGNPGIAAYGSALYDESGKLVDIDAKYLGHKTNNQAEYSGLIAGLEMASKRGVTDIMCYLDSELVVKQIKGEYKVKNENMKPLFEKLQKIMSSFNSVEVTHVYREENGVTDKLVNLILDAVERINSKS